MTRAVREACRVRDLRWIAGLSDECRVIVETGPPGVRYENRDGEGFVVVTVAEAPSRRLDEKRPPPPETLVGALQDRVTETSGRLIRATPIEPPSRGERCGASNAADSCSLEAGHEDEHSNEAEDLVWPNERSFVACVACDGSGVGEQSRDCGVCKGTTRTNAEGGE